MRRIAIAVLVLCPLVARADDAEEKAVKFIFSVGGSVERDEKADGRPVIVVKLKGSKVTDAGLKELLAIKQLRFVDLSQTQITDAGLKKLATIETLTGLNLSNTRVTDLGMKEIATFKKLEGLVLQNTKVTNKGLKEIGKLEPLRGALPQWHANVG